MEIHNMLRNESLALNDEIEDLKKWEKEIKEKDLRLRNKKNDIQNRDLPSVRGSSEPAKKEEVSSAENEKEKGNELFKKGKFAAAVDCYTTAIALEPTNAIYYANRAMAFLKLNKYESAEADCSLSIKHDNTYSKAYFRRGIARNELKKYTEAENDLNKVLELEPGNKQALVELAKVKKESKSKPISVVKSEEITQKSTQKKRIKVTEIDSTKPQLNEQKDQNLQTIESVETKVNETETETAEKLQESSQKKRIKVTEIDSTKPQLNEQKDQNLPKIESVETKVTEKETATAEKTQETPLEAKQKKVLPKLPSQSPTSSFEFITQWNDLQNDESCCLQYLLMIQPQTLAQLFKDSMSANIFSTIIGLLPKLFETNPSFCFSFVENLPSIGRFRMMVMFLNKNEKENLKNFFVTLSSAFDKDKIEEIKKKYLV